MFLLLYNIFNINFDCSNLGKHMRTVAYSPHPWTYKLVSKKVWITQFVKSGQNLNSEVPFR